MVAFAPAEFQAHIGKLEAEIRERSAQVDALTAQLEETQAEKSQLVQQVASINSLLDASQTKKEEENNQVGHTPSVWLLWNGQTPDHTHIATTKDVCCFWQVNDAELEQLKLR